jgi:hypothetical protein
MRALTPDLTLARSAGFTPRVALDEGIHRHLDWLRRVGPIEERFSAAQRRLEEHHIVHAAAAP